MKLKGEGLKNKRLRGEKEYETHEKTAGLADLTFLVGLVGEPNDRKEGYWYCLFDSFLYLIERKARP